jgi:NADPH:quinone reductase-like Zn-dependent oxidoreductase
VTGLCSARNLDLVRSIGADHVLDYTREDFARQGVQYDLIVATAGYRSVADYQGALRPGGVYVCTGGAWRQILQSAIQARRGATEAGNRLVMLTMRADFDFHTLKALIEAGKVMPVIDRRFPLEKLAEAFDYYGARHARGKVVITIRSDGSG